MMFGTLLTMPATALKTAAQALRMLAAVNDALAERLSGSVEHERPSQPEAAAPAPRATRQPEPAPPAAQPDTADSAIDLATLATRPAPEVIAALDGLSTTQLADLYELESRRRRRRSVLAAIDAAAAPPAEARDDVLALDDVREPDVLVFSTSTPRR